MCTQQLPDFSQTLSKILTPIKSPEVNELKKIIESITHENGTTLKLNTDENFLMKRDITNLKDSDKWVVGHNTEGLNCILIVWFGCNYILNLETHTYNIVNVPFLHVDEYDKTIIKGTLAANVLGTATNIDDVFFVAEQVYVYCSTGLLVRSFDDRYKSLFDVKYDKCGQVTFVIMTLLKVNFIRSLMKDYAFPFTVNGMKFISLDESLPSYIWKRPHDVRIRFQIKVIGENDNKTIQFMLLNCKKPTHITDDQRYIVYDGQIVNAMYHDSKWIIVDRSMNNVNNLATYKQAVGFMKDCVMLDTICDNLG